MRTFHDIDTPHPPMPHPTGRFPRFPGGIAPVQRDLPPWRRSVPLR
ncbi:hypothetical protein [Zoogloea oryzae]|nr:hypothetical protein [Zoogloea oryzae]